MLGVKMNEDDKAYYARMDTLISELPKERQQALIQAIKLILRTFTEDDTQGVLLLVSTDGYLTTMGLNATYHESSALVSAAHHVFMETADTADKEVKH